MKRSEVIIPAIAFVMGAISTPIIEVVSFKFLEKYGPFAESVYFDSCLPLRRSVFIIRDKGTQEPLATKPIQMLNETSFFIENNLGRNLSDVTITATPITGNELQPKVLQASIVTNAISEAKSYKMEMHGSALQMSIPNWGNKDAILAEIKLDLPVAYIIEIYSGSENYREILEPGCEDGKYELTPPPSTVFEFNSPNCDASKIKENGSYECIVETSEIEITAEMRENGREITLEQIIDRD